MLAPWKKSYDKPDSVFKAETSLCQQRSVLSKLWFFQWSCIDVRVGLQRKLNAKELMLWTVVLEKTLESPLDSKEIKPVSPNGNQSEYSLEGLMLKLKLQYFGNLMRRADSFEKTLMLGKIEAGGEGDDRGWDGWMASLIQWTWVWASSGDSEGQGSLVGCCP